MTWLAAHWHDVLLAVAGVVLIPGAFWWAEYVDRAEQIAKAARGEPLTPQDVEQHGRDAVAELEAYSNEQYAAAVAYQQGARELDELAVLHPMPQRPGPSPAAPGEPWSLRARAAERLNRGLGDLFTRLGSPPESSVPDVVASGETESNPQERP